MLAQFVALPINVTLSFSEDKLRSAIAILRASFKNKKI